MRIPEDFSFVQIQREEYSGRDVVRIAEDFNFGILAQKAPLKEDGPWTGFDWTNNEAQLKVVNGEVYGTTKEMQRTITAALPMPGEPVVDFNNPANNGAGVQRLMRVLSRKQW